MVNRWIAHLLGWHTNACRGDYRCMTQGRKIHVRLNGWWRG